MEWTDRIRRDLTPFADPGTTIKCSQVGRRFAAEWKSRRHVLSASFSDDLDHGVTVNFCNSKMTYRAFLSHVHMSDMLGLAGMILQARQPSFFVDTQAQLNTTATTEGSALEILRNTVAPLAEDATKIVFVTGDAGAGKTEALKQLVHQQADRYSKGEVDFLYLYVNAQGRALARLDEALATEIQDLRATNLTYHSIPTLTRNGVLVPLIDGFDELLGVLGYEDSFSSLRRFIDDLDGRGSLIASARSTYYQQEFISRSSRASFGRQKVQVDQVAILPWSEPEVKQYVELRYASSVLPNLSIEQFKSEINNAFSAAENVQLKSKPFFLAKASDLILSGIRLQGIDLVDELVNGYVEREHSEKLLDRNGVPLLSTDQIKKFVQLVSDEMWLSETRSLDSDTIRVLAELAFPEDLLSSEAGAILRERAPTMAFFAPALGLQRIEFEHQLFFSYFLGTTIRNAYRAGGAELLSVLVKSVLPEHAAGFAARQIQQSGEPIDKFVSTCGDVAVRSSSRSLQARENAGSLVTAYLLQESQQAAINLVFRKMVFAGESFAGVRISDSRFVDIEFRRSDLTQAEFRRCEAKNLGLHEVIVDPDNTRLEIVGLNPVLDAYGLRVRKGQDIQQHFRHDVVQSILTQCGVPELKTATKAKVSADLLDLLERVLRKFERSSLFWPNDPENKQIVGSESWPELESLLAECGIITVESTRPHKGVPRPALRRNFLPYQIMAGEVTGSGVNDNIRRFWRALEKRWAA